MLKGDVVLPQAVDMSDALMIVRLRDTAMIDAPAPVLALTRRAVSGRGVRRLAFTMRLRRLIPATSRPAFEAELRTAGGRPLAAGDWLTVCHVPYRAGESTGIEIPVERIR